MPPQKTNAPPTPEQQQQQQHVIASPNPTIDDSKTTIAADPGTVTATKAQPATATTSAPMKKAVKPKRKRKSRQ